MSADLVRIIEAAYALEQSEADWLDGLCKAMRPALDVGLGLLVVTVDITSGSPRYGAGSALGNSVEVFRAVAATQPQDAGLAMRPFLGRPTSSLTEAFDARLRADVLNFGELGERYGVEDVLGINGLDPDGRGLCAGVLLPKPARFAAGMRPRWDRIGAHLAASARLRRRLLPAPAWAPEAKVRVEGADAVLTPAGRIEHAVVSARQSTAREQLRAAAVSLDRARSRLRRGDPDAAASLWTALVDGRWTLMDHFDSDGRRFLLAHRNEVPAPRRRGLTPRQTQVLALRAQGHALKLIGYELGMGESLIARDLASGMKRLGLDSLADLARLYAPHGAGRFGRLIKAKKL